MQLNREPHEELFNRYSGNPILTAKDWPHKVNAVFNPAAVTFGGETLLLVRVEDRRGFSHLSVARSADGFTDWVVDPDRSFLPDLESHSEHFGIEDPRITRCGDEYMIVYTGFSKEGPLVCLASTRDFRSFERRGVLMPPEDKDAALFPCQFGGRWGLIHRPIATTPVAEVVAQEDRDGFLHSPPQYAAGIWLSWSRDLQQWEKHTVLIPAREGAWWDANKVGLSTPPLLTSHGWLMLYHGVRTTAAGSLYRTGLALLDAEDPAHVLARSTEWLFGPDAPYERTGDVDQVVFPCGWLLDGDTLRIYYGAADTSVCVATASLTALLDWLSQHSS
jgi:predicted GH43/DUF377 family glycosyl hydrolase